MGNYLLIYDYCSPMDEFCDWEWEYYEPTEEKNIHEEFCGSWDELQDYIKAMKENGCYNISATALPDETLEDWGFCDD